MNRNLKTLIVFIVLACLGYGASYNPENPFWRLIHDPSRRMTTVYEDSPHTLVFDDIRKRTRVHILAIPKKAYVSLPYFIREASDPEILDFLLQVKQTVHSQGLDQTGYRLVSNHSPDLTAKSHNQANQEVGHLHMHIFGGECLGKPVARRDDPQGMAIQNSQDLPFGASLSLSDYLKMIHQHKIEQISYQDHVFISYRVPQTAGIPVYLGFLILDSQKNPVYHNFQEFVDKAPGDEQIAFFRYVIKMAQKMGIEDSGYRFLSANGLDAHQPQEIFEVFIAGGTPLDITASNKYGSKNNGVVYYYDQSSAVPHEHCH